MESISILLIALIIMQIITNILLIFIIGKISNRPMNAEYIEDIDKNKKHNGLLNKIAGSIDITNNLDDDEFEDYDEEDHDEPVNTTKQPEDKKIINVEVKRKPFITPQQLVDYVAKRNNTIIYTEDSISKQVRSFDVINGILQIYFTDGTNDVFIPYKFSEGTMKYIL